MVNDNHHRKDLMSWQEKDRVELRKEFILLASKTGSNITQLCQRYGISRKTGYKWLNRFDENDASSLLDKSTRPFNSPEKTSSKMEAEILKIKKKYPFWGARKIRAVLIRANVEGIPAASTIHSILSQHGLIDHHKNPPSYLNRFEHEAPNHLWQMDFKGNFAYEKGRCFPLTILDDHSRFSICLRACTNEKGETVKPILIETFKRYGLPERINVDNGNPWGSLFECARYTTLSKWLIQIGVKVSFSAPGHPQTNGKEERFHRSLKTELLNSTYFRDLFTIQEGFDKWRDIYNLERPHEGIGMQVPGDRYKPSYRSYSEVPLEINYSEDYLVKKADVRGRISMAGRQIFIGIPFAKDPIGIRTNKEKILEIYYSHQKLGEVNLEMLPKKTIINLYSGRVTDL